MANVGGLSQGGWLALSAANPGLLPMAAMRRGGAYRPQCRAKFGKFRLFSRRPRCELSIRHLSRHVSGEVSWPNS